jgi:RNA recognition motif-containing protein
MDIYVGNISQDINEKDLKKSFSIFGQVENVVIIKDKVTGESRGFGFIKMLSRDNMESAIKGLDGKELACIIRN